MLKSPVIGLAVLVVGLVLASPAVTAQESNLATVNPSALADHRASQIKVTPALPHDSSHDIVIPNDEDPYASPAATPALPTVQIPLTNATSYIMDGVTTDVSPTSETIYNMRIQSDHTSLSDYLEITYGFHLSDQKFQPTQILKYTNIGTANPPYFVKNVTPAITLKAGSSTLNMGTGYSLTTTPSSSFTMSLAAGDVLSFDFANATDDYQFTLVDPYGRSTSGSVSRQTSVLVGPIPILAAGTYQVLVRPINNSSMTFSMAFLNGNRQTMQSRTNGSTISSSFLNGFNDYAKYSIALTKGQYLSLPQPSNSEIRLTLLNSRGAIAQSDLGVPMLYQAPSSGTYYLFIENQIAWGGSYTGKVTIK